MDEFRVKLIIKKTKDKIAANLNIKEDIFALSSIYDFIKDEHEYKKLAGLLKKELEEFRLYQNTYLERKKKKIIINMKLQKESEYKTLWGGKSFFYKLIHRNLSPKNNNLSQMVYDDINQLIYRISNSRKK